MSNIEYINQYMVPVYISSTNMVTPLVTIKFDTLYTNTLIFFQSIVSVSIMVVNIIQIGIQTAVFIMKEGFTEFFANLTIEKIVYILVMYNVLIITAIDNQRRKIAEQKEQIESLEKNILYLKKTERMREDLEESWIQETTKKMRFMENKIKKMDKEIKQYE
jgi:hypothetical protein